MAKYFCRKDHMNRFIPELLTDVNRSQSLFLIHTSGENHSLAGSTTLMHTMRLWGEKMALKTFEDTRVVPELWSLKESLCESGIKPSSVWSSTYNFRTVFFCQSITEKCYPSHPMLWSSREGLTFFDWEIWFSEGPGMQQIYLGLDIASRLYDC